MSSAPPLRAQETEILMAYLPTQPHEVLATKSDLRDLAVQVQRVETRMDTLHSDLGGRIDSVNRRLDRLFLTMAGGLLAVVGTVIVQAFQ